MREDAAPEVEIRSAYKILIGNRDRKLSLVRARREGVK
jgi:hypothetical protein